MIGLKRSWQQSQAPFSLLLDHFTQLLPSDPVKRRKIDLKLTKNDHYGLESLDIEFRHIKDNQSADRDVEMAEYEVTLVRADPKLAPCDTD